MEKDTRPVRCFICGKKGFLCSDCKNKRKYFQEGRQQTLRVLKEFGDKWEIPLEGNVSGEFEYVQFKEHPLFKQISEELVGGEE